MSLYKMIAVDIDGTLLNSKNELSENTKKVLKEASDRGIFVVLTSGRISKNVLNFCNQIGADKYLISENGASIINLKTGELEYSKYISKEVANKVIDLCEENSIYYMVYTQEELIVKNIKYMSLFFYKQNYNPNARIKQVVAGRDYINATNSNITKLMICDEDRSIYRSIINKLKDIEEIDVLPVPHTSVKKIKVDGEEKTLKYSYADISAKGANKWTAVEYLANKLGIKKSEIIAIGDNINDMHMIYNAGLGVAMSNGSPYVRRIANKVAPSNDNDGVAQIVEKYVLRWRVFLRDNKKNKFKMKK
ncbi:MAG: HAD family phosphatase [Clostridia bacterium]|nr:HAD family phosphatase [Clostridia bacterium]